MAQQDQDIAPQIGNRPPYNLLKNGIQADQQNTGLTQDEQDAADDANGAKQRALQWAAIRAHPELLDESSVADAARGIIWGGSGGESTLWVMLGERPDLGEAALKEVKRGAASTDPRTRTAAMSVAGTVALKVPGLAPEVFELAKTGAKDQDGEVRWMAMYTLRDCVDAAPELGETALSFIKPATTDTNAVVRSSAYEGLKVIAEAAAIM